MGLGSYQRLFTKHSKRMGFESNPNLMKSSNDMFVYNILMLYFTLAILKPVPNFYYLQYRYGTIGTVRTTSLCCSSFCRVFLCDGFRLSYENTPQIHIWGEFVSNQHAACGKWLALICAYLRHVLVVCGATLVCIGSFPAVPAIFNDLNCFFSGDVAVMLPAGAEMIIAG